MTVGWKNSFVVFGLLYVWFWILTGWPTDGVRDTIANRIVNGGDRDHYDERQDKLMDNSKDPTKIILSTEFEATWEIGVRRKSNVVGQIFDYLRFKGIF